ncbi:MAG: TolC family protein [Muribaculaceae bacterium]|nr:TolC family protein [Muribaculaceae bacterium]
MKKVFFTLIILSLTFFRVHAQLTLEHCQDLARENYPAIKKYGLLEKSLEIELSDINKSWLPAISLYGQGTVQNITPSFPNALEDVLAQMGQEIKGLGKLQYKIGVDLSQPIWDGGASKAKREMARSQEDMQKAGLEVELYSLRQQVENIFFAILLTQEQINQSRLTLELLNANLSLLESMYKNGTAMQSDLDMVKAQILTLKQTIIQAESSVDAYKKLLGIYVGEDVSNKTLVTPNATMPGSLNSERPELRLFESRFLSSESSRNLINASLMPKIGLFAQAYYGYPGFDYFKSMMNRGLSFNILAGVKASWNIDSFYSKKNRLNKIDLDLSNIEIEREIFLFNSKLQTEKDLEAIEGLKKVMEDDAEIIELRQSVRKAAESQLRNGIIDATALLSKITDENIARLTAKLHEIQYIQQIYNLKNTLNQ